MDARRLLPLLFDADVFWAVDCVYPADAKDCAVRPLIRAVQSFEPK